LPTPDESTHRRLPADRACVRELQEWVKARGASSGFTEELLFRIELALEEVLVNIVNYAYPEGEKPGWVEVECRTEDGSRFTVVVRDGGSQFDPLRLSQPELDQPVAEREVGGLGVFLVREMTDCLSYERKAGVNSLTMCFDFAEATPLPPGSV
jgi:serine/threonine-protein kinase RsbW